MVVSGWGNDRKVYVIDESVFVSYKITLCIYS